MFSFNPRSQEAMKHETFEVRVEGYMTRVTVAMLGARMHYAVPRLFYETGMLERFYTDSYVGNKPWLEAALKAIPESVRPRGVQRWLGRRDGVLSPCKVTSFETLGLWYSWARQGALGKEQ